jgi:phosphatidylethanolamine/phosphatidyl-N-methylethanolamine N-methyltransferase
MGDGVVRARYDRVAPRYDALEVGLERRFYSQWRARLWRAVEGERILELGVGTGKNLPYHPPDAQVVAIDFSSGMLRQARERARRLGSPARLARMDAQELAFPDAMFDTVAATFVFGSVPDPLRGLREVRRVRKPGGTALLLEFIRPPGPLGPLADLATPLVRLVYGATLNRPTVENARRAGLTTVRVEHFWRGAIALIAAVRDV